MTRYKKGPGNFALADSNRHYLIGHTAQRIGICSHRHRRGTSLLFRAFAEHANRHQVSR
ncbi:MAG: hypothetical protein WA252_21005 [Candidatus Sulfotelmatobacter sp.]